MPRPTLAIRFVAGRLEGGLVPLEPGCSLLIGRQPGCDLLLTEDLVSRRHARLAYEGEDLVIEDLGSTNGTFVNGTRVQRTRLDANDRVLVGESIFALVPHDPARAASATEVHTLLERAVITAEKRPPSAIEGRLEDVSLHDLLQLLATGRKTGCLKMRSHGHVGAVTLDQGRVVGCTLDARDDLPAHKSLFRLFGWATGSFDFQHAERCPGASRPVADSTDALLMEGARQLDELRRLRGLLPPRLVASAALPADLDEVDRELVALVARLGDLEAVFDATPLTDLAAAERLAALHAAGAVRPAPAPAMVG